MSDERDSRSPVEKESGLRDIAYLGDGAYAGHDGHQVWAFTFDGFFVQDRVALPNDGTWQKLVDYGAERYGLTKAEEQ